MVNKVGFMVPRPVDHRSHLSTCNSPAYRARNYNDLWAAYNTLGTLRYQYLTVNHTYNFVDPITGTCTNHIESVWQKAK